MDNKYYSPEVREVMGRNRHERRRVGKIIGAKIPGVNTAVVNADKKRKKGK